MTSDFNFDYAWKALCDPNSVADKDQGALQLFLANLGAYEAKIKFTCKHCFEKWL